MYPFPAHVMLVLFLGLTAPTASVQAQQRGSGIQQCERADGTRIYTDQDCAAFAAVPAPVEGELLMRLESDGGPDAGLDAGHLAGARPRSPDVVPQRHPSARSPARGCARSPTQLVMDLRDAWERRDVNRLAASHHWAGSGTQEATAVMSRLEALVKRPLLDIRHYPGRYAGPAQVAGPGPASAGDQLQISLGGPDGKTRGLRIVRHEGCYFVRL